MKTNLKPVTHLAFWDQKGCQVFMTIPIGYLSQPSTRSQVPHTRSFFHVDFIGNNFAFSTYYH